MKTRKNESKHIGRCIYCSGVGTTDEHVVALAFGGYHILRNASCVACRDLTRDLENYLCEHNFNALRFHRAYPKRKRGKPQKRQPDVKIIEGETPHGAPMRKIAADKAPGIAIFPVFPPPGLLVNRTPSSGCNPIGFQFLDTSKDGAERTRQLKAGGMKGALAYAQLAPYDFMRVLAKIAHGYAVFNVGLDGFIPLLPPVIRGELNCASHFVGGLASGQPPMLSDNPEGIPYQISPYQVKVKGEDYLGAQIRLFASEQPAPPIYNVIFGHPTTQNLSDNRPSTSGA